MSETDAIAMFAIGWFFFSMSVMVIVLFQLTRGAGLRVYPKFQILAPQGIVAYCIFLNMEHMGYGSIIQIRTSHQAIGDKKDGKTKLDQAIIFRQKILIFGLISSWLYILIMAALYVRAFLV